MAAAETLPSTARAHGGAETPTAYMIRIVKDAAYSCARLLLLD